MHKLLAGEGFIDSGIEESKIPALLTRHLKYFAILNETRLKNQDIQDKVNLTIFQAQRDPDKKAKATEAIRDGMTNIDAILTDDSTLAKQTSEIVDTLNEYGISVPRNEIRGELVETLESIRSSYKDQLDLYMNNDRSYGPTKLHYGPLFRPNY